MGDLRTTIGKAPPATPLERQRRRTKIVAILVVLVLLVLAAGLLLEVDRSFLAKGYVMPETCAEVRATVPGRVAEILVNSGDQVEAGQLLVRLDAAAEAAAAARASSLLRQLETQLARRQAQIDEARRQRKWDLAEAEARLEKARRDYARAKAAKNIPADIELHKKLAEIKLAALKDADSPTQEQELAAMQHELTAAREALAKNEAQLAAMEINAPIAGAVLRHEFVLGEFARTETLLLEIFGGKRQVLKLRVAERYATVVQPGQRYKARLLPFQGRQDVVFEGKLERLRQAIQGAGRESYRVVLASFDAQGLEVPPGTTAEARVYYGRARLWRHLFSLD